MPLNLKDGVAIGNCRVRVLCRWTRRGHAVFHVRLENQQAGIADFHLLCECDFETVWTGRSARLAWRKVSPGVPCAAKESVMADTRLRLARDCCRDWLALGPDDAMLDLAKRFRNGQYLGLRLASSLTVPEAASLLQMPTAQAWDVCRRLARRKAIRLTEGRFELR